MKVYVITRGSYSDYHICGVAINKADAEKIARVYSDDWELANIEEYDSDDHRSILDGKTAYRVTFLENGNVYEIREQKPDYFTPGITKILIPKNWGGATLHVGVYAKNAESAIKIAAEKRTKWLAEQLAL